MDEQVGFVEIVAESEVESADGRRRIAAVPVGSVDWLVDQVSENGIAVVENDGRFPLVQFRLKFAQRSGRRS